MTDPVAVDSLTGAPVNLKDATLEELAGHLEDVEAAKSRLREVESRVSREIAKRADGQTRLSTDEFQIDLRTYVNVARRLP